MKLGIEPIAWSYAGGLASLVGLRLVPLGDFQAGVQGTPSDASRRSFFHRQLLGALLCDRWTGDHAPDFPPLAFLSPSVPHHSR